MHKNRQTNKKLLFDIICKYGYNVECARKVCMSQCIVQQGRCVCDYHIIRALFWMKRNLNSNVDDLNTILALCKLENRKIYDGLFDGTVLLMANQHIDADLSLHAIRTNHNKLFKMAYMNRTDSSIPSYYDDSNTPWDMLSKTKIVAFMGVQHVTIFNSIWDH